MEINSKKTINDLPEEVMIEIFGYLSPKLLKVSTLVCRRWNETISRSPKILNHYLLEAEWNNEFKNAMSIERKLTALKICYLAKPVLHFMTSQSLTHLELHRLTIAKKQMLEVLSLVKNALSLVFHETKFRGRFEGIFNQSVSFPNLKHLTIFCSDPRILQLISTTTLTEFSSIREIQYSYGNEALDLLFNSRIKSITNEEVNLLVRQQSLRSLKLRMTIDEIFFERVQDFPFELKELSVHCTAEEKQIDTFLRQQKDSLEKLDIWNRSSPTFSFRYEMPKLRNLSVPFLSLTISTSAPIKLKQISASNWNDFSTNLAKIKVLGISEDSVFNTDTVFPNLKELTLSRAWNDFEKLSKIIRNHSTTLEKLRIGFIDDTNFSCGTTFEAIRSCKKLNLLFIDDTNFSCGTTFEAIRSCKKLKLLSVGCKTPEFPRLLRRIELNHPWTLELFFNKYKWLDREMATRLPSEHERQKIVFRFPDDEALFHGRCTTWDDDLIREIRTVHDYGVNAYVNQFK